MNHESYGDYLIDADYAHLIDRRPTEDATPVLKDQNEVFQAGPLEQEPPLTLMDFQFSPTQRAIAQTSPATSNVRPTTDVFSSPTRSNGTQQRPHSIEVEESPFETRTERDHSSNFVNALLRSSPVEQPVIETTTTSQVDVSVKFTQIAEGNANSSIVKARSEFTEDAMIDMKSPFYDSVSPQDSDLGNFPESSVTNMSDSGQNSAQPLSDLYYETDAQSQQLSAQRPIISMELKEISSGNTKVSAPSSSPAQRLRRSVSVDDLYEQENIMAGSQDLITQPPPSSPKRSALSSVTSSRKSLKIRKRPYSALQEAEAAIKKYSASRRKQLLQQLQNDDFGFL